MVDLGTLRGAYSQAVAVNSRGDVVGESETAGEGEGEGEGECHATLWRTEPAT